MKRKTLSINRKEKRKGRNWWKNSGHNFRSWKCPTDRILFPWNGTIGRYTIPNGSERWSFAPVTKKKPLARGYLSAVQIGAPINVARSINPLSKGNVYSGNCVLRHGCTQPLACTPPSPRGRTARLHSFKKPCTFLLGQRMDLFIDLLSPRISPPRISLSLSYFFLQVVCKLLAGLLRMWNVLTGTIIYIYIYICSRVQGMKCLILVIARLYLEEK